MSELPFNKDDLINYLFGSKTDKDAMIVKVIRALDATLDAQIIEWRKLYDKYGEARFISAISMEFARQDADAIRGVCLALLLRQVKAVNIDGERTDSGGIGDATGSDSHE